MIKRLSFGFIIMSIFLSNLPSLFGFTFYKKSSEVYNSYNVPSWIKPYPFNYNPINRPDPFRPVIKIKEFKARKKKVKRSPLDEYEPTQLNLVGIMWDPYKRLPPLALVELPNGKGYVLKEGMTVGPNEAKVVAILKDRVIFVENIINFFGKREKKQIILNLKTKK